MRTSRLFLLCRHFCAPVYSVFLLFVISVLFQNAVTRKTETVRLEHSEQSSPFCLLFLRRKKKKTTEYILVPALATVAIILLLLLYDSFIHGEDDLWDVSPFVFVLLRSFVCLFSFFSVSLCQSTNTDTCSCATEIL